MAIQELLCPPWKCRHLISPLRLYVFVEMGSRLDAFAWIAELGARKHPMRDTISQLGCMARVEATQQAMDEAGIEAVTGTHRGAAAHWKLGRRHTPASAILRSGYQGPPRTQLDDDPNEAGSAKLADTLARISASGQLAELGLVHGEVHVSPGKAGQLRQVGTLEERRANIGQYRYAGFVELRQPYGKLAQIGERTPSYDEEACVRAR